MDNEEFIQRFLLLECYPEDRNQNTTNNILLSSCKTLGIPTPYDEACFMSFGRFRLKDRHLKKKVVKFAASLFFDSRLLYRAMHVLHRRRKFELGLYSMPNGGEVFAIREGENVVLIAPAVYDTSDDFSLPYKDFVVRTSKTLLEKWETWARILHGRRTQKEG